MAHNYEIVPAEAKDYGGIDTLLRAAFDGADEAELVQRLRADSDGYIEHVAKSGANILGHILLSPMNFPREWGALAPLSVAEDAREQGVGSALVRAAAKQADEQGWHALVVLVISPT
ncbi:GNAT family N-acetyltransferase [Falsihalocynthiibacter sp. SS001]|uniref:GNAT family N-acetyltransferase n=1 Tax=Falsihalocynthiibacter sp. SS001 TaxID=3349698 RepID=UPI0036D3376B